MPGGLTGDKGMGSGSGKEPLSMYSESEFGAAIHKHTGYADQGEGREALVKRCLKILKENPVLASRMKTTIEKHPDWIFGPKKMAWSNAVALLFQAAACGIGAAGAAGASSSAAKKVRKTR
jgi:hypothetical protein